jgi:hypothetical protein
MHDQQQSTATTGTSPQSSDIDNMHIQRAAAKSVIVSYFQMMIVVQNILDQAPNVTVCRYPSPRIVPK